MAFDVFISYSSGDRAIVAAIAARLERELLVWWDNDLIAGTDYARDIFDKLAPTGFVLVAWSANAAKSEWVKKESEQGIKKNRLIPILLDDTQLPHEFARLDAIDLRRWDGQGEHPELTKLLRDIKLHQGSLTRPDGKTIATLLNDQRAARISGRGDESPAAISLGALASFLLLIQCEPGSSWTELIMIGLSLIVFGLLLFWVASGGETSSRLVRALREQIGYIGAGIAFGPVVMAAILAGGYIIFLVFGILVGVPLFIFELAASYEAPAEKAAIHRPSPLPSETRALDYLPESLKEAIEQPPRDRCGDVPILPPTPRYVSEKDKFLWLAAWHSHEKEEKVARYLERSPSERSIEHTLIGRPLDIDMLFTLGCVRQDWDVFEKPVMGKPGKSVPFAIDFSSETSWALLTREHLQKNQFDEARAILEQHAASDPAAANILAILDAFELGRGTDPLRAFQLFRAAAAAGHRLAQANFAICHLFGVGTSLDPVFGAQLLEAVFEKGFSIADATWLLKEGSSLLKVTDFSEVVQSLEREASRGSGVAEAILGVFAARGLTRPPCTMPCREEVERRIEALKARGRTDLVALVLANASASEGRNAVSSAARTIEGVAGLGARYRSALSTLRQAEQEREQRAFNEQIRRRFETNGKRPALRR